VEKDINVMTNFSSTFIARTSAALIYQKRTIARSNASGGKPKKSADPRNRQWMNIGAALAVLVTPHYAIADCFDIQMAKPVAVAGTPEVTYKSENWHLVCRQLTRGVLSSLAGGLPVCAPNDPAATQLLNLLEGALTWYKSNDLIPIDVQKAGSNDNTNRFFAIITRTDTNANTRNNPAFYVQSRRVIVFSSVDMICAQRGDGTSDRGTLAKIVAHEIFHAFQSRTPFGSQLWSSPDNAAHGDWMFEGMAEAVGIAFRKFKTDELLFGWDSSYNLPLSETQDDGYNRSHFWYWAADIIKKDNVAGVLRDITRSEGPYDISENDPGISFLERMMTQQGTSLREVYGRVIAEKSNDAAYYNSGAEPLAKLSIDQPTDLVGVKSSELVVKRLATTALEANLTAKLLQPVRSAEAGLVVTDVTWDIDRDTALPRIGLAMEEEWLDSRSFKRVFLNRGRSIDLLARATNVAKTNPNNTQEATVRFVAKARQVRIVGPSCIGVGSSMQIRTEFVDGQGGTPPSMNLRAQNRPGAITGLTFTPSVVGQHVLQVEGYTSADAKAWETFGTVNVRARACGVTMTSFDGSDSWKTTYDASTDSSRIETSDGEVGYSDANGIVGRDEETGGWVRFSQEEIPLLALSPLFGSAAAVTVTHGLSMAAHRGAQNMAEMVKRMRDDGVRAYRLRPRAVPCPTSGSGCVQYDVPNPENGGTIALVFDKDGESVAIGKRGDEGYALFTYDDTRVVVPGARRIR
jgi:hypothetical protein